MRLEAGEEDLSTNLTAIFEQLEVLEFGSATEMQESEIPWPQGCLLTWPLAAGQANQHAGYAGSDLARELPTGAGVAWWEAAEGGVLVADRIIIIYTSI